MDEVWFDENILYGYLAHGLSAEELGLIVKYLASQEDDEEDKEEIEFNDEKLFIIANLTRMLKKVFTR